jgi:concanavalin A-like lectin/glucanase superfamily protein
MSRLARVACTFMERRGQKIYGSALRLDGNDFIEVPETADLRPQKVTLGTVVWDGSWHHVAGTYDGSVVRLFVDGMEIGAGRPFAGKIDYDLAHREFHVGAYRGACDLTFRGDVDKLRLWSAALPVADIWGRISAMLHLEPAAPLPEDAREWFEGG